MAWKADISTLYIISPSHSTTTSLDREIRVISKVESLSESSVGIDIIKVWLLVMARSCSEWPIKVVDFDKSY